MALRTLSICSGYGGIELGLSSVADIEPVCYIERDVAQASVLVSRIQEGLLHDAPIWSDLRTFRCEPWRGKVDVIVGGFPCQPHSVAGKKRGADDERNLWPEIVRLARELGNPALFLENVPGILRYYWDVIKPDLQGMGYSIAEGLYTAAETGAPHRRQRLFFLAHCQPEGLQGQPWYDGVHRRQIRTYVEHDGDEIRRRAGRSSDELGYSESERLEEQRPTRQSQREYNPTTSAGNGETLANAGSERFQRGDRGLGERTLQSSRGTSHQAEPSGSQFRNARSKRLQGVRPAGQTERGAGPGHLPLYPPGPSDDIGWSYVFSQMPEIIPTFCRMVDGVADRMDSNRRLRSTGNGVVPAVAALAWRDLSKKLSAIHT